MVELLEDLLKQSKGGVKGFAFAVSSRFFSDLKEYKGYKIYYFNCIPKGVAYYAEDVFYKYDTNGIELLDNTKQ